MLLGFHGATTMTSDLETDILATAGAGLKGLELWAAKVDRFLEDHSLADLRSLFTRNSVKPIAMNSIEFIAFRGGEYAQIQDRLHVLGGIAREIGCPTIVVVPSPTPSRDFPWPATVAEYVSVLKDLGSIAQEYQLRLSFEFLGFGWCSVRTPRAAAEIIRGVNRENVGMTIDTAHFYTGGAALDEIRQLDPGRIFAFHLDDLEDTPREAISDATRLLPGLGVVPLGEICACLKEIGYDGSCSVELFRPEYWGWDPGLLAQKARQSAESILSPYFQLG